MLLHTDTHSAARSSLPLRGVSGLKFLSSACDWSVKFLCGWITSELRVPLAHISPEKFRGLCRGILFSSTAGEEDTELWSWSETDSDLFYRVWFSNAAALGIILQFIFFYYLHHLFSKMSASGVWIIAMWILLFAIFDVAFSSYSEDQCSWRGRQVFHLSFFLMLHVAELKDASKTRLRMLQV